LRDGHRGRGKGKRRRFGGRTRGGEIALGGQECIKRKKVDRRLGKCRRRNQPSGERKFASQGTLK